MIISYYYTSYKVSKWKFSFKVAVSFLLKFEICTYIYTIRQPAVSALAPSFLQVYNYFLCSPDYYLVAIFLCFYKFYFSSQEI